MKLTMIERLSRYGRHDTNCPLRDYPPLPGDPRCACGFSAAFEEPEPAHEEALMAVQAILSQPVQSSAETSQSTVDILRGDCQSARNIIKAALNKES